MKEHSEYQEQVIIFNWALMHEKKYPQLKYLFATLNGVKLPIGLATKAKKQGNRRGVPDIWFPWNNGKYSGLVIELKVNKNKPTKEQKDFVEFLNTNQFYSDVCWGSKDAIELIKRYLHGEL